MLSDSVLAGCSRQAASAGGHQDPGSVFEEQFGIDAGPNFFLPGDPPWQPCSEGTISLSNWEGGLLAAVDCNVPSRDDDYAHAWPRKVAKCSVVNLCQHHEGVPLFICSERMCQDRCKHAARARAGSTVEALTKSCSEQCRMGFGPGVFSTTCFFLAKFVLTAVRDRVGRRPRPRSGVR